MKTFHRLLIYALIATTTNNFIWFAITFWAYLTTKSVVSTGVVGGIYLTATALSGFWLGSLVDRNKKKNVMLGSSITTFILFTLALIFYYLSPQEAFTSVGSPNFWIFILLLLSGVIAGNILTIAIPTLVTVLVPQKIHDKANGLFGTVTGISFAITSAASGITLAQGGMLTVLIVAIIFTILAITYLLLITIPEKGIIHTNIQQTQKIDIKGTLKVVMGISGLISLIFYTTFNNFLGGIFMALMDAYGLSLVSVDMWGFLLAFLSLGFILGGTIIAKRGLGKNPIATLFRVNIITWTVCIFLAIQPSVILLVIGMAIWMTLVPFIEATEQTIIQKVVPHERQGRVFGFAQSIEQAASPLTAFLIGPIAQFIFIPFMTTGKGVELIGSWFGVGAGRGIALVFIVSGSIGLLVTLIAMHSKSYKLLSQRYLKNK